MTVRSFQDHVQTLIGRRVAEAKVDGANSPDIEARAVLESIALSLFLKPRSVLYVANLARNALVASVTTEIAAVDALTKTIDDLANIAFTTSDTQYLEKARHALLQMENLEKIDSAGGDFQRFSRSVDDFLNKTLSKNVRKVGATELTRSSSEASADLPIDFASLVSLHADTRGKLLALSVGIDNFMSSPLGTVLGLSAAYRARNDIEDIISVIENGDSASQSRDIAVRLIGNRAALRTVGTLPSMTQSLISTTGKLPVGQVISGRSAPTPATKTGTAGPFVFGVNASASITVGTTLTETNFPQDGLDLNNRAFVASRAGISFPVTIPATSFLFVHIRRSTTAGGYVLQPDGSYLRQAKVVFGAGPQTLAQVLTDLNTELGSDATAAEYITAGTGRIIIIGNTAATSVFISPLHVPAGVAVPADVLTESAHDLLGFTLGQVGSAGSTPVTILVDAFNEFFGSLITASESSTQQVVLETIAEAAGTQLSVTSDVSMGLDGVSVAKSATVELHGTVFGVPTDPIDPTPLLDVGDSVETPGGTSTIASMSSTSFDLAIPVNTFDGSITATSALVLAVTAFDRAVQGFVPNWLSSDFGTDLKTLDRAVAALSGKVTPGTRNLAKTILMSLKTLLQDLLAVLSVGTVPGIVGTEEREIVDGIISTLTERKYDRALSFLLQLNIQDFFEMTGDTASFGGNVMKTMSDLATTDINFPNTQADEDSGFKGVVSEPEA